MRVKKYNEEKQISQTSEVNDIRKSVDTISSELDAQAIENIRTLQKKRNCEEEIIAALHKLNSHSLCPGELPTCDDLKKDVIKKETGKEEVHAEDCHCSKCCPNPNPNFFQKHKIGLLITVLWFAIVVLALGISPSGQAFETIQNSWVELIVNFFKMGIFAIAGIATYYLIKKANE